MKKRLTILCIALFILLLAALLLPQFWAEKQRAYRESMDYESHKYESYKEEFAAAKKECMKLLNNREFCLLADALYEESPEGEEICYLVYQDWHRTEHPLIPEGVSVFIPTLLNPAYASDVPASEKVLQSYDDFYAAYTDDENGLFYRYYARKAGAPLYLFFDKVCVYRDPEKEYMQFYLAGSIDQIYLVRGNPEDAMLFKRFLGYVDKDPDDFDCLFYSKCTDTPYTWYMIAFL